MIEVSVTGQKEIAERLAALPENIQRRAILSLSQIVFDHAQAAADRHTVTGRMASAVYNRKIAGGREIGVDARRAPHAVFVHWGTRPHVIRPRNKKALRWAGGGGFIFAKFVNHPGYKGDPFLVSAAREAVSRFDSVVQDIIKEI